MPMPDGGHWPPLEYAPAYQAYREWHAWLVGEPDLLTEVYTNRRDMPFVPKTRPSQYAGGIFGRAARWLWGTPPSSTSRDPRLHIPAPADLARVSADLLFAEPPTLALPKDRQAVSDPVAPKAAAASPVERRLAEVADEIPRLLLEGAEVAAALGDVYLRVTVDLEISPDRAFLTRVDADGALPRYRHGRLIEVTFWTLLQVDGQRFLRLLEHHMPGRVEYGLFDGTELELGRRIPLGEHRDAEYLAPLVDAGAGQDTGIKQLAVVAWPNIGPQRRWRTVPHQRHLGRSDFDGIEPLFDALDRVWSSWMWDIQAGKGRIIVPDVYLESNGPGGGASWDAEREIYAGLNMLPKPGGENNMIEIAQFAIRVQEHRETCDAIWREILRAPRYSEQTFGEQGDGGAAVTATEIGANERVSFTTRDRKAMIAKGVIMDAVELLMAVEQAQNLPAGRGVEAIRPDVTFGDSVSPDPLTTAQTAQALKAAGAASTRVLVEMVHPNWDTEQIDEEVQRIEDEVAAALPPAIEDPGTFRGDVGDTGSG
jgi:hypothetical protein